MAKNNINISLNCSHSKNCFDLHTSIRIYSPKTLILYFYIQYMPIFATFSPPRSNIVGSVL